MIRGNRTNRRLAARGLAVVAIYGAALFVSSSATSTQTRIARADQGSVELLVTGDAAGRDGPIEAGLRFRLRPGWHIYWRNPGDSDGPPTVKWSVPGGVIVSEFSWPTPERVPVGPLVNYGYHGDVVLPFTIRMPAGPRSRPQVITADVRWLVCKDICVPVKSTVALSLPLDAASQAETPAWTRLIATASQRVPTEAPSNWRATATDAGDAFLLTITPDQPASGDVNFFPLHESQVEDAAKQVVQRTGARLTLRLEKSAQLAAIPRELTGVLTIGKGRGYIVAAPVQARSLDKKGSSR